MLLAAEALGYEYVAITDHSQSSAIARGLDVESARAARWISWRPRGRRIPGIAILQGSEVDILPDGSLDFPDAVLERLDVVLASLHDPAGHSGPQLTDRYVRAMRHPLVQIVTHPTNRLVPHRDGYPLDEPRLFEAAVETGTILEIDGAPGHLDMDGEMARRAVAAGANVSVDGDCHRADLLGRHMLFAVGTARRGWVAGARRRQHASARRRSAGGSPGNDGPAERVGTDSARGSRFPPAADRQRAGGCWCVRDVPRHAAAVARFRRHRPPSRMPAARSR